MNSSPSSVTLKHSSNTELELQSVYVAHDREEPEDLVMLQPIHGQYKMPFDLQMDDGSDDIRD